MTTWTSGYVADIGYTFGYYNELNPLRVRLAFLNAGLVCPEFGSACELGFGQGMSANIHAAASVCSWAGTDFNPAQAGFAQELALASGSGAQLFDESFAEFASRDLPEFDYIGLHGIWSWISDENRAVIVDFIRRKLKVGGVLYISYNTLPGWGAFAPMRHLMTEHAEVIGSEGRGIVSRINDAIDFTERLLATNPLYARANPQIAERIKKLKEHNRHYLAHEYFNRDWHPMHFATMAQWLEPAKLQYACSANYVDHVEALNLTPEQQTFLNEIPDAMFRQTVRDFMVNQQFRKDYWVKGARRVNALQQSQALMQQRVILSSQPEDIKLTVQGAVGEAKLSEGVYSPIIQALADHKPHSVQDLIKALQGQDNPLVKVVQALLVLTAQGHVHPVQAEDVTAKAANTTKKLNQHLQNLAKGSADVSFLASPVTGGGIAVGRIQQLFLLSIGQGKKQPQEWVQDTWALLKSQGHRIVKAGQTLQADEENLAELGQMAADFQAKALPVLRGLRVV
ncbi:MAG: class I SAM-dependent methyltransferase [Betaproteobacteria bacterium]